jgi:glycolate oxidase iron-sulfur subunit
VAYGDIETTRRMARHNIEAFEKLGADYIVTSCASCGGTLKKEYPYVLKDVPGWKERAERFAAKVLDVQEFLVRKTDYRKHIRRHLPDRVTYHDPCHMKRVQEISQEPREVLKAIAGDNFVEMKDADACCGSAGTFSLKHYELSRKINQRKVDNIRQSGAAVVATPCPGCMMHIKNGVHLNGMAVRVTHPILLLAEAYKAADGSPLQASDVRPEEHAEVVC